MNKPSFVEQQEQEENSLRPDEWSGHRQHYQVLLDGISLLPDRRQQVFRMTVLIEGGMPAPPDNMGSLPSRRIF